jgi:hypothetical protein
MNKRMGMYSSITTLLGVIGFAISMIVSFDNGSYFFSLIIAWGFVPMVCSFASIGSKDSRAAGFSAIAFASIYVVLVGLVYFAQLTTLRLSELSEQAVAILDYQSLGSLFFNYDLLGYAFMALATFFIGLTIEPKNKQEKILKILLLVHGIFSATCILMPILGVFNSDMAGGEIIGVLVLEFWCIYFTPICVLSYFYFKNHKQNI